MGKRREFVGVLGDLFICVALGALVVAVSGNWLHSQLPFGVRGTGNVYGLTGVGGALGNGTVIAQVQVAPPEQTRVPSGVKEEKAEEDGDRPTSGKLTDFFRVRRDGRRRPVALETAIVHYTLPDKNGQPVHVDLVAAIHVGERAYYEELNRRFTAYDAVLFELVAPEDFRVPEGARLDSQSPIGFLQKGLQNLLGLEYQLHVIDYSRPNFVHADMSPAEFAETMQKRGESFWQMFWKLLRHGLEKQAKAPSKVSDVELLLALFRQDRVLLKRILAEEFVETDDAWAALAGDDGGSTIITERNKKALQVLRQQLDKGKRRLAIFYGAAHLPDMETRLKSDFQAERGQTEWVTAWDLKADHSRPARRNP